MTKKRQVELIKAGGGQHKNGQTPARNEADVAIADAIRQIRICQSRLDRKVLHGSCGKQEMVATIYRAGSKLLAHPRARKIEAQLAKKSDTDRDDFDIFEALIILALPDLQPAVVDNWVCAIHFVEQHHVRGHKVRGFLFVKGGINSCADLYRKARVVEAGDEEEDYRRPWKIPRRRDAVIPRGVQPLFPDSRSRALEDEPR